MNKTLRARDFALDEAAADAQLALAADDQLAPQAIGDGSSRLNQLAQSIIERIMVTEEPRLAASANSGSQPSTGTVSVDSIKNMQGGVSAVAAARHLLSRHSMNRSVVKSEGITFSPVQEWEGYVVEVNHDHLVANLVNLTAGDERPTSTVELPFEELSPTDVARLRPGKVFRWAIGYVRKPGGTRMRGSEIVFRDLPQWTKGELAEAQNQASALADFFAGIDHEQASR